MALIFLEENKIFHNFCAAFIFLQRQLFVRLACLLASSKVEETVLHFNTQYGDICFRLRLKRANYRLPLSNCFN